jgi:hypothetical protein
MNALHASARLRGALTRRADARLSSPRTLGPLAFALALAACSDDTVVPTPGIPDTGIAADAASDAGSPPDAGSTPDAGTSPDAGAIDPGDVLDLGAVTLFGGKSTPVPFELPADVTSFMVVIEGPESAWYVVEELEGPTGVLVSDDASMVSNIERFLLGPYAAQFKSPNRVTQDWGISAATFPNNPGVTVQGGAYTLVVGGLVPQGNAGMPYSGDVNVKIYLRRAVLERGKLDVHLYFTGAGGFTADSARADTVMQGALDALRTIYGQMNVTIGDVTYADVDAQYQVITDLTNTGGDLDEMFRLSTGSGGLHFFFVSRFMGGFPGGMVAGISGGLPGAPGRVGTVGSGVAVGVDVVGMNPQTIAHVMAHEGGHWLGLFHTSEVTGTEDQHPETPGGQAGNMFLMYPAVGGGTQITPSQGAAVRRHLTVQPD